MDRPRPTRFTNNAKVMGRHLVEGRAFGIYEISSGRLVRKVPLRGAKTWWQPARDYYTSGALSEHLIHAGLVRVVTLEAFVRLANNSEL